MRLQPLLSPQKGAQWCQKCTSYLSSPTSRVAASSHKIRLLGKTAKRATHLDVVGVRHFRSARIMGLRKNKSWLGNLFMVLLQLGLTAGAYPQNAPSPTSSELPDSPGALPSERIPETTTGSVISTEPNRRLKKYSLVISPDELAGPLTTGDKLKLSVISRITLSEAGTTLFYAGISQLGDTRPHYGTDSGAFGQRLGAFAIKQTTQSIFAYGIYASLFHDDPRYYIMGRRESIKRRAIYSATRLLITRKDNGSAAFNWPRLAGIASATALTNAYYPVEDRGVGNTFIGFANSLGTSVLNNEIHEFIGDAFQLVRHKK